METMGCGDEGVKKGLLNGLIEVIFLMTYEGNMMKKFVLELIYCLGHDYPGWKRVSQ